MGRIPIPTIRTIPVGAGLCTRPTVITFPVGAIMDRLPSATDRHGLSRDGAQPIPYDSQHFP